VFDTSNPKNQIFELGGRARLIYPKSPEEWVWGTFFILPNKANITATAPTNVVTDTAILPGNTRFYRVGVEP
jgi:hypothetical protein